MATERCSLLLLFQTIATLDRQELRHRRPRSADAHYGALAARGDLQLDTARLALRARSSACNQLPQMAISMHGASCAARVRDIPNS